MARVLGKANVDRLVIAGLLEELLDGGEGKSRFAPLRRSLKQDEVAFGHGTAKVQAHVPRVELLIDQLPLVRSFRESGHQVDFGFGGGFDFLPDGDARRRLRLTPSQLDLQAVGLLDQLTV